MTRLPDDHIITPDDAAKLIRRGLRLSGARWVVGMTVAEVLDLRPWVALPFAADRLSDDQFARAAMEWPWEALEHAADRLTDDQFAEAARFEPWAAQRFATDRYHAWRTANASA